MIKPNKSQDAAMKLKHAHARFRGRRGAQALALLAVFVRVFLPAGLMPKADAGAIPFSLVICTGFGIETAGAANEPVNEAPAKSHDSKPCLFAGIVAASEPGPFTVRPPRLQKEAGRTILDGLAGDGRHMRWQSYPRAPPPLTSNVL
jgi:hypothetical protein